MDILPDHFTNDQKAAIAAFTLFMMGDDTEFVISGPAGVGKTTLLKHLYAAAPHVKTNNVMGGKMIEREWNFTATTNKAAEVLSHVVEDARTIYSLLGLRVYNDFEKGTSKVSRSPDSTVLSRRIIVVDECSMIDTQLMNFIRKGTIDSKIIYVGDHCQLAPIFEPISPVFKVDNFVRLDEIIRSKDTPDITALSNQLRQTVETGVFKPIREVPGIIDFLTPSEAEQQISDYFINSEVDSRIMCYTNRKVIGFNNWIRELRDLPPEPTQGEILVANNAAKSKYGSKALHIEQEVRVLDVVGRENFIPDNGDGRFPLKVFEVSTPVGSLLMPESHEEYDALVKYYAKLKNWRAYFDLKERVADLRPRDAATVYKAQGSTYKTAFVDLADIGRCNNASQVARMLYVAVSRATHEVKFIGRLPKKYSGE